MSGPYDQQQAFGQTVGYGASAAFNAAPIATANAAGSRQRLQRGGSSTSLSSDAGANAYKGVGAGGAGQQSFAANGFAQGGNFAQGSSSFAQSGASFGSVASGPRRKGRTYRETIRLPDQGAANCRQVRRRLPTPEPDTLERV